MWGLLWAVVALGVLPLAPAGAQTPAARQWTLPNGLRVVCQSNPTTATVVVCGFVRVTVLHELRVAPGVRQLTNMVVAHGGSREQLIRQIAARVEGALAADYAEIMVSAAAEDLEPCLDILAGVLYAPQLDAQVLETQRMLLLRELAARSESPAERAFDLAHARLYPELRSKAWLLGDPETISHLTLEQVRGFHAAHYLPNATVISVSGAVSCERTREVVGERFGRLLPGGLPEPVPMTGAPAGDRVQLRWPGATAALCVAGRGVSLDSEDYPAAATAMVLLGSGAGSRLHQALRRDRSLAYTIQADITPSAVAPVAAVLVTTGQDQIAQVETLVLEAIDRLGSETPSLEEVRAAKRYLMGQHALRHQRNGDLAHYLGLFELLGGAAGYRLDGLLPARLAAVAPADVSAMAAHMFRSRAVAVLADQPR